MPGGCEPTQLFAKLFLVLIEAFPHTGIFYNDPEVNPEKFSIIWGVCIYEKKNNIAVGNCILDGIYFVLKSLHPSLHHFSLFSPFSPCSQTGNDAVFFLN